MKIVTCRGNHSVVRGFPDPAQYATERLLISLRPREICGQTERRGQGAESAKPATQKHAQNNRAGKALDFNATLWFTGRRSNVYHGEVVKGIPVRRHSVRAVIAILIGALGLSLTPTARAQYTNNFQDTIISGATSNWSGSYIVGSNTFADILFVQNGGVLADGNGYLGYDASGSNNVAAVIDSGSVWSNAGSLYIGNAGANNFLWIADGGAVVGSNSFVGYTGTNNEVLVDGPGSVWSNNGDLTVGYNGSSNALTITGGATVYNNNGHIGFGYPNDPYESGNNVVIVSGNGSVWSNSGGLSIGFVNLNGGGSDYGNALTITNGGAVYSAGSGAGNSFVVVTGNGSIWNNSGGLAVSGYPSASTRLTIADGGVVYSIGGNVQAAVLVTGPGSVWSNSSELFVQGSDEEPFLGSMAISNGAAVYSGSGEVTGYDAYLQTVVVTGPGSIWRMENSLNFHGVYTFLTISDGGAVDSGSVDFDGPYYAVTVVQVTGAGSIWRIGGVLACQGSGSVVISDGGVVVAGSVGGYKMNINVADGGLYITNAPGIIGLGAPYAFVTLNGGTVTANQLVVVPATQYPAGFGLNSGLLTSGSTYITNGNSFVVGDGTDAATFHLAGGFHSFADGLMVSSNSFVTGCGTIDGSVVVDPGATVLANCGGSLTFTGIVINNGTLRAINGSVLEFYGPVVNNGLIDITGGTIIFHSIFINNGTIIGPAPAFQITGIVQQANNILVTWATSPGQTNELQVTAGGPGGCYSTNNFTAIFAVTNTVGSVTNYLDVGGATNTPSRYYRVRLVP
jgi:T5SS/PEP-CTERM-associated repeat protein